MGIIDKIRNTIQAFSDGTIPVGGKILRLKTTEFLDEQSDKYEDITKLLNDERIFSLVALTSSLIQSAYKGIHLKPTDRYTDKTLTKNEIKVLKLGDEFADPISGLDFKQLFFDIGWSIALYGEERYVYMIEKDKGITELKSVPLNSSYFVDNTEQINSVNTIVRTGNILVVNKNPNNTNPDIIKEGGFEQIAYHKRGVWRRDIHGRDTYGVYPIVPGKCLQNLYKWKLKTMENDVAWKNKLMPRILHELDMGGISAAGYPGKTKAEKNAAALADAQKIIQNFKNNTKIDTPDEDLIVSKSVVTKILEATSTNYMAPNDTLEQINKAFNTPFGIPEGQIGGESGSSMGAQLDSYFESIRIDTIASLISKALTKALHKHLIINNAGLSEEIKRLYVHIDTMIPVHRFEMARTILSLAQSGVVLKTETREMINLPRIPQLPKEDFMEKRQSTLRDSPEQIEKDLLSEVPGANDNNEGPGAEKTTSQSQR